jgi:hypothetical protein
MERLRPNLPLPASLNAELTLRFTLPDSLRLCVPPGRWGPCIHQARVDVFSGPALAPPTNPLAPGRSSAGAQGWSGGCEPADGTEVQIRGFNGSLVEARRIVFDQAKRFLIAIAGGADKLPRESFTARLVNAREPERYRFYAIVIGADISITHAVEQPELVA